MGRTYITPFPGPNQAALGIIPDLTIPTAIGPTMYAGYIFTEQFGYQPTADISQNGRDASDIGVDFSRGDFPQLTTKSYMRMPFSPADFMGPVTQGSIMVVVKTPTGTGLYQTFLGAFDTLGPTLNNVPDTHTPLIYIDNTDKVICQQQFGGFLTAPALAADLGATGFQVIGLSLKQGDGTNFTGAIRAYRKRQGQASQYSQTLSNSIIAPGTNPLWVGINVFGGSGPTSRQVAAAFFFPSAMDQAAFDTAYTAIATLVNPFLATAGGAL